MAALPAEIVFLTALGLEYDAVHAHLTAPAPHVDSDGTHYAIGTLLEGGPRAALALIGEGNLAAAVLTSRAIQEFHPKAVILVGVAGGLTDDAAVGDVVVATRVHAYQGGREESETFRPRARSWPVAHGLEQVARQLAQSGAWAAALPGGVPRVHFKAIVSGDVVLDSRTSASARLIATYYSDAVAIDMESAGVAEAAHRKDFHQVITIRGISDTADGGKRHSEAAGSQQRAATHAAAFTAALARAIAGPTSLASGSAASGSAAPGRPVSRPAPPRRIRTLIAFVIAVEALIAGAGAGLIAAWLSLTGPADTTYPGWVLLHRERGVSLADAQVIDLETGDVGWENDGTTGNDLRLARAADRMITTPPLGRVKVLDSAGAENPERCATHGAEGWDGTIDGLKLLTPGRNICLSTTQSAYAILTVVRPPDDAVAVLSFHYSLWKRDSAP